VRYVLAQRPVMVRGARAADDVLRWYSKVWRKKALLKKYGDAKVNVADIPYVEVFTHQSSRQMSLREYVAAADAVARLINEGGATPSQYVFIRANDLFAQVGESADDLPNPQWVAPLQLGNGALLAFKPDLTEFYVGAPGSGAPFHSHSAVWNYLAHGRKAWALTPPEDGLWSVRPALNFFEKHLEQLPDTLGIRPPRTCVQEAGDLLVLPPRWGHATLNLRSSVGIAREFKVLPGRLRRT